MYKHLEYNSIFINNYKSEGKSHKNKNDFDMHENKHNTKIKK